jgi:hypothetical protein
MRPITRRVTIAILVVLALLLALGALPSYLQSGDPYYVTATVAEGNHTAVDVTDLSERRYEYTSAALDDADGSGPGVSEPYWKGPFGVKESFTNSPFDEIDALRLREASAADGDGVYVSRNGTLYRLAVTQDP